VVHAGWNKKHSRQRLLKIGKTNLSLVPGRILSPEPVRGNPKPLDHADEEPVQKVTVMTV
jgi:hypothetical protein